MTSKASGQIKIQHIFCKRGRELLSYQMADHQDGLYKLHLARINVCCLSIKCQRHGDHSKTFSHCRHCYEKQMWIYFQIDFFSYYYCSVFFNPFCMGFPCSILSHALDFAHSQLLKGKIRSVGNIHLSHFLCPWLHIHNEETRLKRDLKPNTVKLS